jgi:hypothetical protein
LRHLVGLDTCDHIIITKVVPAQLAQQLNRLHPWTVVIKTEFSDQLEAHVPSWQSIMGIDFFYFAKQFTTVVLSTSL